MKFRSDKEPAPRSAAWITRQIQHCLSGRAVDAHAPLTVHRLWDRAACSACEMEVGGLLDESLTRQGVRVPDSARRILQAYRRSLEVRNRRQREGLIDVVDALDREGIPFRLMKGLALNETLYRRDDVRGSSDIDLLIHPEDAGRVDRLFARVGLRPEGDTVDDDFFPRFYYEKPYVAIGRPELRIDLHARPFRPLLYRRTLPADAFWDKPVTLRIQGRSVPTFNREHMLIHLCVHAAAHGLEQLRWLYDIYYFLQCHEDDIDWNGIVETARRWRLSYAMRMALLTVWEAFAHRSASLDRVLVRLASDTATIKERLAIHQAPRDAKAPLGHVFVDTLSLSTVRDRLDYLKANLFPAAAHMKTWYPHRHPGWKPLAHALRLLRGARRV